MKRESEVQIVVRKFFCSVRWLKNWRQKWNDDVNRLNRDIVGLKSWFLLKMNSEIRCRVFFKLETSHRSNTDRSNFQPSLRCFHALNCFQIFYYIKSIGFQFVSVFILTWKHFLNLETSPKLNLGIF